MSRNVTILVIILVILLIAGYLLWLRGRFAPSQPATVTVTPVVEIPTPTAVASPSAVTSPSPTVRPTGARLSPTPTPRTSTSSGQTVR